TKTSIASGVQHGIVAEAEHLIGIYKRQFKGLKVIVTGGDMAFFADRLKTHIFAAPDLTLVGLNSILNYNLSRQ
ncbi:MAG TPA: pantothenate kinase, partial [Bacteroidia bacterium]|nr:pantothenate kinase [Bacteroidia bacterium]